MGTKRRQVNLVEDILITRPMRDKYGTKVVLKDRSFMYYYNYNTFFYKKAFISCIAARNLSNMMEIIEHDKSIQFPDLFKLAVDEGLTFSQTSASGLDTENALKVVWTRLRYYIYIDFFNSGRISATITSRNDPVGHVEIDATSKSSMTAVLHKIRDMMLQVYPEESQNCTKLEIDTADYKTRSYEKMSIQPLHDGYCTKVRPEDGIFVSYQAMNNFSDTMHLLHISGVQPPDRYVLSAEGGLAMCWLFPKFYANIEFFNDGEVVVLIDNKIDPVDIFEIDACSKSSIIDGLQKVNYLALKG